MKHIFYGDLEVKRLDDGAIRVGREDRKPVSDEEKKIALALADDNVTDALKIFNGTIKKVVLKSDG